MTSPTSPSTQRQINTTDERAGMAGRTAMAGEAVRRFTIKFFPPHFLQEVASSKLTLEQCAQVFILVNSILPSGF
jgi:hypothetical protein